MPRPKILAAVINSDAGRHAGREAIRLSLAMHAGLSVISVVPSYNGNMSLLHINDPWKTFSEPHEEVLAAVVKEAESAGVPARRILESGEAYERIVYMADAQKAEMIVIGSGRKSLIERSILGSTAARVIGYSKCDVMVIPLGTTVDFRRILLAADGSPCSRNAARKAIELAGDFGGAMKVVHVIDVPPEYYLHESVMKGMAEKAKTELETIRQWAAERELKPETVIRHGENYQGVIDTAREDQSDLIVIGSCGRSGISRLLMGSVVERVLAHAPCPVLVVH